MSPKRRANAVDVALKTLAGGKFSRALPATSTPEDLAAWVTDCTGCPADEQLLVACGSRLAFDKLHDLAPPLGPDSTDIAPSHTHVCLDKTVRFHLVRRPRPDRRISVVVRCQQRRLAVEGVRATCSVPELQAAVLATLVGTGEWEPSRGLDLLLQGRLLDGTQGLCAVEYGLRDGSVLMVAPRVRGEQHTCVAVKVLGVPVQHMSVGHNWTVAQFKGMLFPLLRAGLPSSSALQRQVQKLDIAEVRVLFAKSAKTAPASEVRKLAEEESLRCIGSGGDGALFVLPGNVQAAMWRGSSFVRESEAELVARCQHEWKRECSRQPPGCAIKRVSGTLTFMQPPG